VLTRLTLSSLHAPFLVAETRSTLHFHSQNVHRRIIRLSSLAFTSKKLTWATGNVMISRSCELSSFNSVRADSLRRVCSFQSVSSDASFKSMWHAVRLAIRYFAGRASFETASYQESLLCISLSLRTSGWARRGMLHDIGSDSPLL
jgi:hypothetical protein